MISPGAKQNLISIGNETFDKFLGGGFVNSSLNIFERQGPPSRILDSIWNKSFAAATLTKKDALVYVNCNTSLEVDEKTFLASLPSFRKVKSELMYKDVRGKSASTKIKIAWRYSNRGLSSPSDSVARMNQIDFGLSFVKDGESEETGRVHVINVKENESLNQILAKLEQGVSDLKQTHPKVNIIIKDLLHPFSPIIDDTRRFLNFIYTLRCFSRGLDKGAILVSYDRDLCNDHFDIQQQLYNLADCVVSFYSYETGENRLTGYKDIDGTLSYVKVPKINSFGFHFQQDLSDWSYRLTKNHRFFVIDELSLPPCDDDEEEGKGRQTATKLANIENVRRPLEQVGPLEEFREVAKDVLAKKL